MTVRPTTEKIDRIKVMCLDTGKKDMLKIRDLAQLIGSLVGVFPGVEFGPLHYRGLEKLKTRGLKQRKGDFNAKISLDEAALDDLNWWVKNVECSKREIDHGQIHCTFRTDASMQGWGAHMDNKIAQARWSDTEATQHINFLEMLGALFGIEELMFFTIRLPYSVRVGQFCSGSLH